MTVNKVAIVDTYPLPRIHDLFMSLSWGKSFCKLDLAHAYQQILLDADSKRFVTINTIVSLQPPTIWGGTCTSNFPVDKGNLLQGITHVTVNVDDILMTGASEEEHLSNLEEVLTRLEAARMKHKCAFMLSEVEYLGHKISHHGLHPTAEKVRAIADAPPPQKVSQLKSFLGLLTYYGKFLSNLSTVLAPLYLLLQKQKRWSWGLTNRKPLGTLKP